MVDPAAVVIADVSRKALEDLKAAVRRYQPQLDLSRLDEAFLFAARAHQGQKRESGDDFINHPISVAMILAELELDEPSLVAAILHDVVEDTDTQLETVRERFGDEVASLVDGVTKLNRLQYKTHLEAQAENLRKMFLAMADDIRVVLIKLADRLHNMRTMHFVPQEEKRRAKARETLEIFAPLAHRLGIFRIKWELEDLALKYLQPQQYRELAELIPRQRRDRDAQLARIMAELRRNLAEAGIDAEVEGRAKHFYSIYKKIYEQGKSLNEIYDLTAVRILVESVRDCYAALGVVHTVWRPLPGRFKDYIATPKSNMYQSLHTTVIGPTGEPFEIQIRTWEMHRTAEYGIAAHWRYKEGGRTDREFDEKLSWLRSILEWQADLRDAREFMEALKLDVFDDEVFVFTPRGDVIELPAGSTPIDFAYRIHTEIGHRCVGVKINGRIQPLDTTLKNGDIVEILTNNNSVGPSRDWLSIVKTSTARNRIRQFLKREQREENIRRGWEALEREARSQRVHLGDLWQGDYVAELCQKLSIRSEDELLMAIGFGGTSPAQVIRRLSEIHRRATKGADGTLALEQLPKRSDRKRSPDEAVQVKGIDNILVRFSRCCNPVPGDPIVGYITRGRGVSIHHRACRNFANLTSQDQARWIEVSWDNVDAAYYPVHLVLHAIDRPGLLLDVAQVVAETRTNIVSAKARASRDQTAVIDLIMEIRSLDQLGYIQRQLQKVNDVLSVARVNVNGQGA